MDPLAGMDDSSTDDDNASQTTEDDPQVPEHRAVVPPQADGPPLTSQPLPAAGPSNVSSAPREKPHYELRHVMNGHTESISSVKFSPDGSLLASCGS